ncbi:MAG: xanthine dehydrogenase family protein subunit M [Anaerolineales bacterium]|jgi:CO/xanthine dehydrogenase FAD-binding subunit
MKPASFKYLAPTTLNQALEHLAEHNFDAKVIAGGQSLIPMMNFRLAQPSVLIDLNKIEGLSYIREEGNELRIGTMTRHVQVERDALIAEHAPLVREAMTKIATPQIRNRGTFGGSIAHADPAAELTAVTVALDARFKLQNSEGERWVPAKEFFFGMFTTVIEPDEMLVEVAIPFAKDRTGYALEEEARRSHDFAMAGVAAVATVDEAGLCEAARLVFFSIGDAPGDSGDALAELVGQKPTAELIERAVENAVELLDPSDDIHATAEYRLHLARVLGKRALRRAFDHAADAVS